MIYQGKFFSRKVYPRARYTLQVHILIIWLEQQVLN